MDSGFHKILIGYISSEAEEDDIISVLEELKSPEGVIQLKGMERRMFTNYRILETDDENLFQKLTEEEVKIKGQIVECHEFKGEETYKKFIEKYQNRVVFLTGIPLTCEISFIRHEINQRLELRDLFILRINKKVNKHFGFATFNSKEERDKAIAMKKLKMKKFKITFKDFKAQSLEKKLFKKEKKPKKSQEVPQSEPQEAAREEQPPITEEAVQEAERQEIAEDPDPSINSQCNIENPEDAMNILKADCLKIKSNHILPGNVSFNQLTAPRHREFPTGSFQQSYSEDPRNMNRLHLDPCNRESDQSFNSSLKLFLKTPLENVSGRNPSNSEIEIYASELRRRTEPVQRNERQQDVVGAMDQRTFQLFGNYHHVHAPKFHSESFDNESLGSSN